jgi:hypothetical protein
MWELEISATADAELKALKTDPSRKKQYKAVTKALGLLCTNPRHPGLNTHLWKGRECPHGDKLWEAYAENNTPGAYRIFFCYRPQPPRAICVIAITPHP